MPSQQKAPKSPNAKKLYKQGIDLSLQYAPILAAQEAQLRAQQDPQRIAEQQALQAQYGPTQYAQQLAALNQIDPGWTTLRNKVGANVSRDLDLGGQLTPEMETQLESQIRAAQAARGNTIGNAAATAEEIMKGTAALQLYQQRLQNAGNFLAGPTPEQQMIAIQPVSADRSSAYTNPNAGLQMQQFGLQNYQNQLAQYQLSGGGKNPWGSALGGAASGAAAGSVAGPYGAIGGALIGGATGYFSDKKLKTNIKDAGVTLKTFQYKNDPTKQRYMGVIAQELNKIMPHAVGKVGKFLTVSERFAPIPVHG